MLQIGSITRGPHSSPQSTCLTELKFNIHWGTSIDDPYGHMIHITKENLVWLKSWTKLKILVQGFLIKGRVIMLLVPKVSARMIILGTCCTAHKPRFIMCKHHQICDMCVCACFNQKNCWKSSFYTEKTCQSSFQISS